MLRYANIFEKSSGLLRITKSSLYEKKNPRRIGRRKENLDI